MYYLPSIFPVDNLHRCLLLNSRNLNISQLRNQCTPQTQYWFCICRAHSLCTNRSIPSNQHCINSERLCQSRAMCMSFVDM